MVHANEQRLKPRDIALGAASSSANAEVLAALWDLIETMQRSKQSTAGESPAQIVLIRLAKLGPTRVSDLAGDLHLDQSTVSRHLTNLVDQGLVARESDPSDRRAHVMTATDAGHVAAQSAIRRRVAMLESVIADWSDDDRENFSRLLNDFAVQLNTQLTEGARA